MDERIGGGGSERLRQMHMSMAIRFYCSTLPGSKYYAEGYESNIFVYVIILGLAVLVIFVVKKPA